MQVLLGVSRARFLAGVSAHVEHGELVQNRAELLVERVLGKLDLAHVEITDPADLEVFVDNLQAAP